MWKYQDSPIDQNWYCLTRTLRCCESPRSQLLNFSVKFSCSSSLLADSHIIIIIIKMNKRSSNNFDDDFIENIKLTCAWSWSLYYGKSWSIFPGEEMQKNCSLHLLCLYIILSRWGNWRKLPGQVSHSDINIRYLLQAVSMCQHWWHLQA